MHKLVIPILAISFLFLVSCQTKESPENIANRIAHENKLVDVRVKVEEEIKIAKNRRKLKPIYKIKYETLMSRFNAWADQYTDSLAAGEDISDNAEFKKRTKVLIVAANSYINSLKDVKPFVEFEVIKVGDIIDSIFKVVKYYRENRIERQKQTAAALNRRLKWRSWDVIK